MNTLQTIICLLALIATGLSVYILARTVRKQSEGFRHRRQDEGNIPSEEDEDLAPEVEEVEGPSWDKTTKCITDNASYFMGILVVICIMGVVIHYMMKPSQPSFSQGMMGQAMMPQVMPMMPQMSPYGYRM